MVQSQTEFFQNGTLPGQLRTSLAELIAPLGDRFAQLGCEIDAALIAPLVDRICKVDRETIVENDPRRDTRVSILLAGSAFPFSLYPDGRRHIGDFFGPGSIYNWAGLFARDYRYTMAIKSRSLVVMIDRARLSMAMRDIPELGEAIAMVERAHRWRLAQRSRGLISLPASERLLIALLDIRNELRGSRLLGADGWMNLPLTLRELGDFTGLTDVHVSRTLKRLQEDGTIERRGKRIRLPGLEEVERMLDYQYFDPAQIGMSGTGLNRGLGEA